MQALLAPPREELDEGAVREALSLARGAKVRHGVDVLDLTDTLTEDKLRFYGGSVTWSYRAPDRVTGQSDDVAAVRRRASLVIPANQDVPLESRRLRLWTEWQLLDGGWARFHLGVFVVTNPGALQDDGTVLTRSLTLADKSHIWATTPLAEPVMVPADTPVVPWVRARLQAKFGETHFALPTSTAALAQALILEPGISELEACSRALEAVALDQLTANGSGLASTRTLDEIANQGPEHTYGAGQGKVLTAGEVEPLLPSLPNVVRFSARQGPSLGNVEGNGQRTVKNQSTGPASIDSRGREVELRVDVDADDQATLDTIAVADAQRYFAGGGLRWTGEVGINPLHSDRDVVGIVLPRLGLASGDAWQLTEWNYPLNPIKDDQAVLMKVTAERRVVLS